MEKLRSMMALWQYMDSCLNRNRGEDAILRSAIETFYEKTEFKKFFKYNTLCIEKLLENIDFPSANGISKKGFELYQCNKVLLLIVDTAVTFRMNAGLLFGLENLDVKTFGLFKTNFGYTEPWTAKDKILQFLESQFDSTTKFLETQDIDMDVDEEYNGGSDRENFKKQLYRLGDVLLDCFFQKCSITQLREKRLEQRLHTLANKILLNICGLLFFWIKLIFVVKVNKEFAFFLGSKYCCYELLVRLSLKLEPAEVNSKLAFFLKKFEYEFAKQLFEYRLREGSFHKIFDEKEAPTAFKDYDKFLGIFLMEKQGSLNIFSWIQEIKLKNYHAAAEILSGIADTELDFSKKRVANSLSFLALVADENIENFTSKEKLPPSLELRYWDNIKSQDYSELQFLVLNSLKERALLKKPNAVTAEDLIEANFKNFMEDKPGYKLLTLKALETCISNHHVDELLLFNIFLSRSENDGDIEFSAKLFMEFTLFLLERSQKELVFGYEVHTKYEFLWKMLWRRAYLFTDWQQFTKLSKMATSDQSFIQGKQRTMVNTLFQTISNYQNLETEQKRLYIFEPNEHVSFSEKSLRLFKSFLKNSNFTKKQEEKIIQDFTKENENMKVVNDLQGAKLLFNSYLRESGLSEK
ncbi:hypothetical protein HDU92_002134 [Lobulomyces angularis]|nr:hypothetical protein HDU92_002134 [Lobulomyces angularis]